MTDVFKDDVILEVKPFITAQSHPEFGIIDFEVTTGAEDQNRSHYSFTVPDNPSCYVFTKTKMDEPVIDMVDEVVSYFVDVTFYQRIGSETTKLIDHKALYKIRLVDGKPEASDEEVADEVRQGWQNALTKAITSIKPQTTPVFEAKPANQPNTPVHQAGGMAAQEASKVQLKNIPTSWLFVGASALGFIFALLVVFLMQSILNPANAKQSPKTASTPEQALIMPTEGQGGTGDDDHFGINSKEFARAQTESVAGMLKQMGIDPTHNQQDMGCLVE